MFQKLDLFISTSVTFISLNNNNTDLPGEREKSRVIFVCLKMAGEQNIQL